jgi:hypothetical protein
MKTVLARIGFWWCRHMHTAISRPVSGHYVCLQCLRQWRSPW